MAYARTLSTFYALHKCAFEPHLEAGQELAGFDLWPSVQSLLHYDLYQKESALEEVLRPAPNPHATTLGTHYGVTVASEVGRLISSPRTYLRDSRRQRSSQKSTLSVSPNLAQQIDDLEDKSLYRLWSLSMYFSTLYMRAAFLRGGLRWFHYFLPDDSGQVGPKSRAYDLKHSRSAVPGRLKLYQVCRNYFAVDPEGLALRWDTAEDHLMTIGALEDNHLVRFERPPVARPIHPASFGEDT